jgi:DNA-binding NarL/FixJ family response regulator
VGGRSVDPLIGRRDEIASLERLLDQLDRGQGDAVALVGEPGIGKTRLLAELRALSSMRGHVVLGGAASELERDVPFAMFIDALDGHLGSDRPDRISGLDESVTASLAQVFPSLRGSGRGHGVRSPGDRHRMHGAIRTLLTRLGRQRPLVLVLDDIQWADQASAELLDVLLRRRAASVLLALALRPVPPPKRLLATLAQAERATTLVRLDLGTLMPAEAARLVGDGLGPAAVQELYEETGGNPFYLQQLARAIEHRASVSDHRTALLADIGVPPAVAAALAEELDRLSAVARRVFDGAAIAGDPFDLEISAAAAGTTDPQTFDAVDELVRCDLVRPTDAPRRFRFRHPLVRRAAYESSPAAWRVGAHARCADALLRRGAPAAERAHHVCRSAAYGDLAAVATLKEAGDAVAYLAPESAVRWFDAALDILPASVDAEERVNLLLARSAALTASGHVTAGHETLLDAVRTVPDRTSSLFAAVTAACAREERLIGRYEPAHARLVDALRRLSEPASIEAVGLLIELTLNEFYRARYDDMAGWATQAAAIAAQVGDPLVLATALSMPALAHAVTGEPVRARALRDEAAATVDVLPDEALVRRVDAATWLSATELYLDMYTEADGHASRALDVARSAGHGDPVGLYQILPRVWFVRGKLGEAAEMLDGAIEGGRLLGTPPSLAGNLFNRSAVALAAGDLPLAYATAEEGARLAGRLGRGFVPAWSAVRLAAVLLEMGEPERASDLLLDRGGDDGMALIPGGWRVYCLELLTLSLLAANRRDDAERAAQKAVATAKAARLPLATAWSERAVAAIALEVGDASAAADYASASADRAVAVGAPIEAGLSQALAGRAFARSGNVEEAVALLVRAAAAFDATGALRYRERTEQELGKLGRRPHRRSRHGLSGAQGVGSLTERELQVARLVVDRKTNPEIAAELFLSQKTVESHLRNVFNKVGVDSRVALARLMERSATGSAPTGHLILR